MSRPSDLQAAHGRPRPWLPLMHSGEALSTAVLQALELLGESGPRCAPARAARPRVDQGVWSLTTDGDRNLLAPGTTPRQHLRFAFFAGAVVRAFACEPELGDGRELDLGPDLQAILADLARGVAFAGSVEERADGVPALRRVAGHDTARGFTGAGFALGALGPLETTAVNTMVADAITEQVRSVQAWLAAGENLEPAVREVVADAYRRHRRVLAARREPGPAALRWAPAAPLLADPREAASRLSAWGRARTAS